jgi:predicted nucleic acid-binding protein
MPVVDASVYVAFFKADEEQHIPSRRWLRSAIRSEEPIFSPLILLPEVASALGRGLGDPALADAAVSLLRSRRLTELLPITHSLAIKAARIAAEQRLRGCDAVYVALAQQLGMALVTFDRDQLERGGAVVATRMC